jgi:hypothetical protein
MLWVIDLNVYKRILYKRWFDKPSKVMKQKLCRSKEDWVFRVEDLTNEANELILRHWYNIYLDTFNESISEGLNNRIVRTPKSFIDFVEGFPTHDRNKIEGKGNE